MVGASLGGAGPAPRGWPPQPVPGWRGRPLFGALPGLLLRGFLPSQRLTLRERLRSCFRTGCGEVGWFGGHSFYLLRFLS